MPTNQELVNGLLRGSSAPLNFTEQGPPPPLDDGFTDVVPALSRIRGVGSFKRDDGAFIPPDEIPNYGMPTSRFPSGYDSTILSRREGGKSVGVTDGRNTGFEGFNPGAGPSPMDFFEPEPSQGPSAMDQFNELALASDQQVAQTEQGEPLNSAQPVPAQPVPYDDSRDAPQNSEETESELDAIEAELAANQQLGSMNRRRIQDLIFN